MSLYSVCFQFVCVLPFLGDFRTLFQAFSDFDALFSNFSIVHGCDFTVCLLLGLLSFCCPFGFFFSYNTCVVYVFVFPLRKQLLCHVSDG